MKKVNVLSISIGFDKVTMKSMVLRYLRIFQNALYWGVQKLGFKIV